MLLQSEHNFFFLNQPSPYAKTIESCTFASEPNKEFVFEFLPFLFFHGEMPFVAAAVAIPSPAPSLLTARATTCSNVRPVRLAFFSHQLAVFFSQNKPATTD
jgi:hypothetical protein